MEVETINNLKKIILIAKLRAIFANFSPKNSMFIELFIQSSVKLVLNSKWFSV